jgi:hypothetical protein
MTTLKRLATFSAVAALACAGTAPSAFAGVEGPPPPPKGDSGHCNSGNGNGSDAITWNVGDHCYGGDPGNSFNAGNKGGDEIPTSGGVANPGGNNVP